MPNKLVNKTALCWNKAESYNGQKVWSCHTGSK